MSVAAPTRIAMKTWRLYHAAERPFRYCSIISPSNDSRLWRGASRSSTQFARRGGSNAFILLLLLAAGHLPQAHQCPSCLTHFPQTLGRDPEIGFGAPAAFGR